MKIKHLNGAYFRAIQVAAQHIRLYWSIATYTDEKRHDSNMG